MNTDNNKRTLSWGQIVNYGAGGMFTYGFQLVLVGYFLNYFMTNVIMLPTAIAAVLNIIIQWVKVITMILAGIIIDATAFKSGKYRTWYLICGIVLGVTLPLTFLDLHLAPAAAAVFFIIMYTIMMTAYNMGWTALRTLAGVLGKTGNDSVILGSTANVAGTIPSVLYPFIGPVIFSIPLWAGTTNTYFGFGLISGIIIIIGGFIIFNLCKNVDNGIQATAESKPKAKKIGMLDMFKNLKGPGLIFFISYSFNAAQSGFFSVLLVYYANYVLKNPTITSSTISATAASAMIGSFFVPAIAKKLGKKTCYVGQLIVTVLLYIVLAMVGNNGTAFVIVRSVQTLVSCFNICLLPAFMVDIADYNEMNGDKGARAFLQSMGGTATRLGSSLSAILASFALAAIGFNAQATEISATVTKGITNVMILGPAICCAIAIVFILFYKIDENALNEFRIKQVADK